MNDPVPWQGQSDGARLSGPQSTDALSDRRSESLTGSSPASALGSRQCLSLLVSLLKQSVSLPPLTVSRDPDQSVQPTLLAKQ